MKKFSSYELGETENTQNTDKNGETVCYPIKKQNGSPKPTNESQSQ